MDSKRIVNPGGRLAGLSRSLPPPLGTRLDELRAAAWVAREGSESTPPLRSFVQAAVAPRRRVLCVPGTVRQKTVLAKLFAVNGYRPVFDPTHPHDFSVGVPAQGGRPTLNGRHVDNKKTRVAEAWVAVAGYPLAVDPLTYAGLMVEKSEANATHDGRVVEGPLASGDLIEGKVYQRLVDNSDGDEVIDLRVPLYGGRVPFVYFERRPISGRFAIPNTVVVLREPADVFSADELDALGRFAHAVGLDYGEADVLRDNASGRIYVVDSTNGPFGPPNGLSPLAAREAIARLAAAFDVVAVDAMYAASREERPRTSPVSMDGAVDGRPAPTTPPHPRDLGSSADGAALCPSSPREAAPPAAERSSLDRPPRP